jgi:hypothetical protein
MLDGLYEHPTGIWFDGYSMIAAMGLVIALALAMRDVAVSGGFGLASLSVPVALVLLVWNFVAATHRARAKRNS